MKKHYRRKPWRPTYSAVDVLLASPNRPMAAHKRTHQLTKMYLALDALGSGKPPSMADWFILADAINLVETLVLGGIAQDESGLLQDAVNAVGKAWERNLSHPKTENTAKPSNGAAQSLPPQAHPEPDAISPAGLAACCAVVSDWQACMEQLPERTIVQAHIATEKRLRQMLRGSHHRNPTDLVINT